MAASFTSIATGGLRFRFFGSATDSAGGPSAVFVFF
jgi:hypothetical protein